MATTPRTDFGLPTLPSPETSAFRIAELVRLQKSAQRITASLDLDEIIERVVSEIASSLGCVEINLYLHQPEQGEMVLAGVRGCTMYGKGHRLKIGTEGMVGYVAATRQMRYAPDVTRDPYYMACEPATRSEVAIPLQVENDSGRRVHRFALRAERFLARTAAHAARAVRPRGRRGAQRAPLSR